MFVITDSTENCCVPEMGLVHRRLVVTMTGAGVLVLQTAENQGSSWIAEWNPGALVGQSR